MRSWVLLMTVICGCSDPITAKGANDESDGESEWDWNAGPSGADTGEAQNDETQVRPSIQFAQALCDSGGQERWKFTMTASDPQGLNTLSSEALVSVFDEESMIGTHELSIDDSFRHGSTVSALDVGISCPDATEFTFSFVVSDQDGNESEPEIVTGREE